MTHHHLVRNRFKRRRLSIPPNAFQRWPPCPLSFLPQFSSDHALTATCRRRRQRSSTSSCLRLAVEGHRIHSNSLSFLRGRNKQLAHIKTLFCLSFPAFSLPTPLPPALISCPQPVSRARIYSRALLITHSQVLYPPNKTRAHSPRFIQ